MAMFLADAGLDESAPPPPVDPTPEMAEAMAQMQRNMDFFLGHMWVPLLEYAPDVNLLRSLPITVAVGEASEGQVAHRAATALAERLGKEPVIFPGAHSGLGAEPAAFARRLHEVLSTR